MSRNAVQTNAPSNAPSNASISSAVFKSGKSSKLNIVMNKREAPSSLHNPTATKKKKRVTIHEDLVTPGDSGWNDDAIEDYAIEEDLEPCNKHIPFFRI